MNINIATQDLQVKFPYIVCFEGWVDRLAQWLETILYIG